jgi:hypothetical protein
VEERKKEDAGPNDLDIRQAKGSASLRVTIEAATSQYQNGERRAGYRIRLSEMDW